MIKVFFFHSLYFQVCLRIRPLDEDESYQGATRIAHKVQAKV